MQFITVAVVDIEQDQQRHTSISELLRHNTTHFELLTDLPSAHHQSTERRCIARDDLSFIDNVIARIRRLNPQIVLMSVSRAMHECCDLLLALHDHCPGTQALLVIDDGIEENDLIKALACGARGFISERIDSLDFSKVISAIERGEAWVPRRIAARLMHRIVSASRQDVAEADFDSFSQ